MFASGTNRSTLLRTMQGFVNEPERLRRQRDVRGWLRLLSPGVTDSTLPPMRAPTGMEYRNRPTDPFDAFDSRSDEREMTALRRAFARSRAGQDIASRIAIARENAAATGRATDLASAWERRLRNMREDARARGIVNIPGGQRVHPMVPSVAAMMAPAAESPFRQQLRSSGNMANAGITTDPEGNPITAREWLAANNQSGMPQVDVSAAWKPTTDQQAKLDLRASQKQERLGRRQALAEAAMLRRKMGLGELTPFQAAMYQTTPRSLFSQKMFGAGATDPLAAERQSLWNARMYGPHAAGQLEAQRIRSSAEDTRKANEMNTLLGANLASQPGMTPENATAWGWKPPAGITPSPTSTIPGMKQPMPQVVRNPDSSMKDRETTRVLLRAQGYPSDFVESEIRRIYGPEESWLPRDFYENFHTGANAAWRWLTRQRENLGAGFKGFAAGLYGR